MKCRDDATGYGLTIKCFLKGLRKTEWQAGESLFELPSCSDLFFGAVFILNLYQHRIDERVDALRGDDVFNDKNYEGLQSEIFSLRLNFDTGL